MRLFIAVMVLCFATNLQASKKNSPVEPAFVGYSTGVLAIPNPQYLLLEGTELCKETFGIDAAIATSKDIKAAINNGTFSRPLTSYAVFLPSDAISLGMDNENDHNLYDPHLNIKVPASAVIGTYFNRPYFNARLTLDGAVSWRVACITQ